MKTLLSILLCLCFSVVNVIAQANIENPVLTFSDEFEGTGAPDAAKWDRPEYNRRNNANGPDGYWSREDSYLDGEGNLVIRVRKVANKNGDSDPYDYSVGALRTKGKFEQLYGRFEIRCKLPTQAGWWVAFWMMQGTVFNEANLGVDGSEVDIMEGFGWTNKINHAIHYDGYGSAHKSVQKAGYYSNIRTGFHTYALEWTPSNYKFYVDDVLKWTTSGGGVCTQAGYVKVTGEISTEDWAISSSWSNNPETATYPDSFLVDYVRVYNIGDFYATDFSTAENLNPEMAIYPNPSNESVFIEWVQNSTSSPIAKLEIVNALGQVIKKIANFENRSALSIADLEKGIYILNVGQKGLNTYKKFVKY